MYEKIHANTLEQYAVEKLIRLEDENNNLKDEITDLEERVNEAEDIAVVRFEIIKKLVEVFGIKADDRSYGSYLVTTRSMPTDETDGKLLRDALTRLGILEEPTPAVEGAGATEDNKEGN